MVSSWKILIGSISGALFWILLQGKGLASPATCLRTSSSIVELATCLGHFTVPTAYYDDTTYAASQPHERQLQAWKQTIQSMLFVDGNCSVGRVPDDLQPFYNIEPFKEFCVLYETTTARGTYLKGWGFMIVPATHAAISRHLHISAPHPGYDGPTAEQAAFLFNSTGASTLLVPGRWRDAFLSPSKCIAPPEPSQHYFTTDPAHNNLEPFFDANTVIFDWQSMHHGCPSSSCAFLQFHGKSDTTCLSDDVFLSAGLGNSAASRAWYSNEDDRPIKRLKANLQRALPPFTISLPSDSKCGLTATRNVVGRFFNNIDKSQVCNVAASTKTASGIFIHAEQSQALWDPGSYQAWSEALLNTFETTCSLGAVFNPVTNLCFVPEYSLGEALKEEQEVPFA